MDPVHPAEHVGVPQSEPLDETQVRNNAGGFVYKIDDFARLRRFIILGSNGNNYYVSSKQLGLDNCECVLRLLAEGHGLRVVEEVTLISTQGRAPRQTTGILVLAVCACFGDIATRRAALAALPTVCRTASTLFDLVQRCKELGPAARATRPGDAAADPPAVMAWLQEQRAATVATATATAEAEICGAAGGRGGGRFPGRGRGFGRGGALARGRGRCGALGGGGRGRIETPLATSSDGKASWGRSMRRAVALWYLDKSPAAVAYQATKYSQRNGWSHADLLRLAHPDPEKHAAKRLKAVLTTSEAATAAAAEDKEGGSAVRAGGRAAAAAQPSGGTDSDWVMVPQEVDAGTEDSVATECSELGALLAAMTPAAGPTSGDGGDAAVAMAAKPAEAQRVADMKAIFDFLTHGTLPGQERPTRRSKGQVAPGGSGAGGAEGEVPAAAQGVASDAAAGAAPAASVTDAGTAKSLPDAPADSPATMAESADEVTAATAAGSADTDPSATAAVPLAAAATTTTIAAATTAVPLSPVMQYIVDAHRLRKEIRAPPPLVKPPPPEPRQQRPKRRRGGAAASEPEAETVAAAKPAAPPPDPAAIAANEAARAAAVEQAVQLVRRHRFGHEHVGDTALLRIPELWAAFLEVGMPLTALVRNLGRMTQMGLMERPTCLNAITRRLRDARALALARVHPMTLLEAMCTYRAGEGALGVARWDPAAAVLEALEAGFYLAFKNVRPTGRRYLAGLDVSSSMQSPCGGMTSVYCNQAAAALLMCLVRSEPWVKTLAFSHQLVQMDLKAEDSLEDVVHRARSISMGGTDCSLPIVYALERRIPVDVFVILTDNETWYGNVHPTAALHRYRATMGLPDAKLVVLALSGTEFSIADPADPGMLDIAGLDSAVPQLIADFVSGRV